MKTYVALLHSVILTPQRRVVMADLRAMALDLGYSAPRTLVSTGNLVFTAPATPVSRIEARLEAGFAACFGRHVDIIVRDAEAWRRLIETNPFNDIDASSGDRLLLRIMRAPLQDSALPALAPFITPGLFSALN